MTTVMAEMEELYRSSCKDTKRRTLTAIAMFIIYAFFPYIFYELGKDNIVPHQQYIFLLFSIIVFFIIIGLMIMFIIDYFNIDDIIIFENGIYIPFRALPSGIPFSFKNDEIIEWYSIRNIEKIYRGLVIHTIQNKSFLIPPQFNLNEIEKRIKQHWTAPLKMDT